MFWLREEGDFAPLLSFFFPKENIKAGYLISTDGGKKPAIKVRRLPCGLLLLPFLQVGRLEITSMMHLVG